VVILTEGKRDSALQNVDHGLADYFEDICTGNKDVSLFQQMRRSFGAPHVAFMIGDQLDRDISPAKQVGFTTIHFPGGFQPKWAPTPEVLVRIFPSATFQRSRTLSSE
jgi:putative hydrolase of the HAD superfamily